MTRTPCSFSPAWSRRSRAARGGPRKSATWSSSCCRTAPRTSTARRSPWTAATPRTAARSRSWTPSPARTKNGQHEFRLVARSPRLAAPGLRDLRERGRVDDLVADPADTLDLQGDHVAGNQRRGDLLPRATPDLGEAAALTGARGQQVAGGDGRAPGGEADQLLEGERAVGQGVLAQQLAVDPGAHGEVEEAVGGLARLELVGGHQVRAQGVRAVLALEEPERHPALGALDVSRRPVVEDRVADD